MRRGKRRVPVLSDGGCWQYRTFDTNGNVVVYLVAAQSAP